MKLRDELSKLMVSNAILIFLFFTLSGLAASITLSATFNSNALSHAVLAENVSTTD